MRTPRTPSSRTAPLASFKRVPFAGLLAAVAGLATCAASLPALAQPGIDRTVQTVLIPIGSRQRPEIASPITLNAVSARIEIRDQIAMTTLELSLANPASTQQEAQLLLPVPDGVVVRSLHYDGVGPEPKAEILDKAQARAIYDAIVRSMRDPALVEFFGSGVIKVSAFPIPPGKTQKLSLTYEQVLTQDAGRVDFTLPRSQSLAVAGTTWTISASIRDARGVASVYSTSHDIATTRIDSNHIDVALKDPAAAQSGSIRLSYVVQLGASNGPVVTMSAYPDPSLSPGGGFFMLMVSPPANLPPASARQQREVTIVVDRSGSMRGDKIKQALAAATQVVNGLADGERFNIIDYSDSIASFAPSPMVKDARTTKEALTYINAIQANGGTNIHDALMEALTPQAADGTLPMVLFLTDGLATVGVTNEVLIRDAVKKTNTHGRRIFGFGVGLDVNTPLLSNISAGSRGATTFVLPDQDVEVAVSQVFRRLAGPVLASPTLRAVGKDGEPQPNLVRDTHPRELPDLFEGDQLVVLGQYIGDHPPAFTLEGSFLGKTRTFNVGADIASASVSPRNAHVPRLWALRKVAALVDEIRQAGASGGVADGRMKELTDEIVRLSKQYGILTEYTSFLAKEDTPMPTQAAAGLMLRDSFDARGPARAGPGSMNQEENVMKSQRSLSASAAGKSYLNERLERVEITTVNQIADLTFFKRPNNRWVDARLLDQEDKAPDQTIAFASPEYDALVDQLIKEGRQAALAQRGEIYLQVANKRVLVQAP
jgi:Ca-activated chloride channel family protein